MGALTACIVPGFGRLRCWPPEPQRKGVQTMTTTTRTFAAHIITDPSMSQEIIVMTGARESGASDPLLTISL